MSLLTQAGELTQVLCAKGVYCIYRSIKWYSILVSYHNDNQWQIQKL